MRVRKQTGDGDYVFGNGQADFYRDVPEAPGTVSKMRLELWEGEWFLDLTEGTAYVTGVLGKQPSGNPERTIRDRINGTQGMVGISSYESAVDPDTRIMSVEVAENTIYGPTSIALANVGNF